MNYADVFKSISATMDELEQIESDRTTHKVKDVERLMVGSIIGKEVTKCSKCLGRVDLHDKYCKHCGRQFLEV